jgi:hypothetical protein
VLETARGAGNARDRPAIHRHENEGEEFTMAAHAGETARETGDFHCQSCNAVVHVTKGKKIPECPNGHKTFDTRTGEPGNKSS